MQDAVRLVDLLQEFIEAVVKDESSDRVEDRKYLFEVRNELIDFLRKDK